ncbi:hypothetical protein [Nocardia sp. NPDC056000]|uniref:hypothetical protein n=1 Tax=Nocardia sp. NPDC056000 TaxID=3345674 RepID=UPI0035DE73A2
MAIERFGGTPEDPNRRPDSSDPAATPDHTPGDESRISASDSGPSTPAASEPPTVETGAASDAEPPAEEPKRAWGQGGHTIKKRSDTPAPDPNTSDATDRSAAESTPEAATSDHPGGASIVGAMPGAGDLPTPPTFEMPVPPLEPGTGQAPPPFPAPAPFTAPEPRRGSMQRQEAGVTAPRPPTVAEARAREKARKRAEEAEQAAAEAAETKRKKKKKVLIGGAAVVGVAALVGGGYLAYDALTTPEVTAYCTVVAKKGQVVAVGNGQTVTATSDNQEIVIPDNYCDDAKRTGSTGLGGIFILNGSQYRYYYGGSGNTIGHAPTGGSTVLPKGADVKTKSGSTIQRGGLGSKISGGGS